MSLPIIRPQTPDSYSVRAANLPSFRPASRDHRTGYQPRRPSSSPGNLSPSTSDAGMQASLGRPATTLGRSARCLPQYFFTESVDAERNDRFPAATHYQVVDETIHTGSYERFGYVDFLTLPVASGIINKSGRTAGVMDIARWLNTSKGRTKMDTYPLLVLGIEIIKLLVKEEMDNDAAAVASLIKQINDGLEAMRLMRIEWGKSKAGYDVQIEALEQQATDLEEAIKTLEDESATKMAHLQQLIDDTKKQARQLDREIMSIETQIGRATAKLAQLKSTLENALDHAYEPAMLAKSLAEMIRRGDLVNIFKMLSDDDKLALTRYLLSTCDAEEKNMLLGVCLESFNDGELDVALVKKGLSGPQKDDLLQMLLKQAEHAPAVIAAALTKGDDVMGTHMTGVGVGLISEAVSQRCDKMALLAAIGVDAAELARRLLKELGLADMLAQLGLDKAAIAAALGLEDPALTEAPPTIDTADFEGQTPEEWMVEPEPEPEPPPPPPPPPKRKPPSPLKRKESKVSGR